ncbi:DNA-binding domain-containing protein [Reyranella sp.]|uniref:HvfC/BufC N-terminal domain-containing protein n=1 Tax=Reyranella sp. TaxID=1929291 RepID=UPI0025CC1D43|nr:DNA-binding domain-containing protein [Reyranella sp.]
MLGLRDLQAAFAAHLEGEDRPSLADAVMGDTISAAARLRIHRHHVAESLATALAATYSTVQAIVGEDFFRGMAKAFAATDLPRQPVLAEYGGAFPAFVARYGPAASLPYLADMARLDWALNLAFHAPWRDRLSVSDLADLPSEGLLASRVSLAAGSTLVRSAYPIDRIWEASRPGAAAGRVSLDEGPASVIVLRRSGDAAFARLCPAETAFVEALADGKTLEEGAHAAFAVEPAFDLSTTFARLLALQAFAALQHES